MEPYHLAKLIQWAPGGELKSRKRMQKIVFLLQTAGCKALDADFTLHHYGPYSQDVAALTDQMVSGNLLVEEAEPNQQAGCSYSYQLSEEARQSLIKFENEESGRKIAAEIEPFESRAKELLQKGVRDLEYAATAAYFYRQEVDWKAAEAKTCAFKRLKPGGAEVRAAVELARRYMA
jgi:uncharacterized protein YwgA